MPQFFPKIFLFLSKCLFFIFLGFLFFGLGTKPIFAVSEFETSYRLDYTVSLNGDIKIDQKVSLTNRLTNVYATQYQVTIGSNNIREIKAWDKQRALPTEVSVRENKTEIIINFPDKIVGKNLGRQFHLSYESPDFAQVKGRVLEVGIPLLSDSTELSGYEVELHVPNTFGKASYIQPTPSSVAEVSGFRHYFFSQEQLGGGEGIMATFGEYQLFAFTLSYHLLNDRAQEVKTQIALPADTSFQRLAYTKLEPPPESITLDEDGNWLATYTLTKKQKLEVTASGMSKVFLKPQDNRPKFTLSPEKKELYLKTQPYWPVDNPEIKALAEKLKTPEAIYDFLVKNFTYDYQRLEKNTQRMGAAWALSHPQELICMEFTDLFITLARAAGIPAREANGFAYTTNDKLRPLSLRQDVLHSWPEYYDEERKLWLAVDPTWGNTTGGLDFFHKLDLDHFTFVQRGVSSDLPLPAGSYKLAQEEKKDVNITFATQDFPDNLTLKVDTNFAQEGRSGLPFWGEIYLKNVGSLAAYDQGLNLSLYRDGQQIFSRQLGPETLPPLAQKTVPVTSNSSFLSPGGTYRLVVEFGGEKQEVKWIIRPWFNKTNVSILVSFLGLGLFLVGQKTSRWLTRKH